MSDDRKPPCALIVIPCLNEETHIGGLVTKLLRTTAHLDVRIVVADGGSTDATIPIVEQIMAGTDRVALVHNPRRLQAPAVNLAVERFGVGCEFLLRIDAHGRYPSDYCERLLEDARRTGADSVVVSMRTEGRSRFQQATAAAQNSRLGTGGSSHRHASGGAWVDHGHHALMRMDAFRAVGGYDESFSHNEDAELDHRLRAAGYRIWLSGSTYMIYYPRSTIPALFRQYLAYGRGRARNMMKHRARPKLRQALPLLVFPTALFSLFSFVHWSATVPAVLWAGACLSYAGVMALQRGRPSLILAGVSAMVMHLAWSLGFWLQVLGMPVGRRAAG